MTDTPAHPLAYSLSVSLETLLQRWARRLREGLTVTPDDPDFARLLARAMGLQVPCASALIEGARHKLESALVSRCEPQYLEVRLKTVCLRPAGATATSWLVLGFTLAELQQLLALADSVDGYPADKPVQRLTVQWLQDSHGLEPGRVFRVDSSEYMPWILVTARPVAAVGKPRALLALELEVAPFEGEGASQFVVVPPVAQRFEVLC